MTSPHSPFVSCSIFTITCATLCLSTNTNERPCFIATKGSGVTTAVALLHLDIA